MLALAEYAAAVGVESFLLDVGWCVRAGLDPFADHEARGDADPPDDLAGLLARIRGVRPGGGAGGGAGAARPRVDHRPGPPRMAAGDRAGRRGRAGAGPVGTPGDGLRLGALDQAAGPASGVTAQLVAGLGGGPVGPGREAACRHVGRLPSAGRGARALSRADPAVLVDGPGHGPPGGRDRPDRRLDPPAPGVRLAGAAAAPGPDLAAGVRRGGGCDLAGVPRRRRVLRPAGHRHGPAQAGRGQPAGDPPLAGALQGVPAAAARRPNGAFGPERQRVRRSRGGGGRSQ